MLRDLVVRRVPPIHSGQRLLLKPFGFQIGPETLSSNGFRRWLARHYPHLWIRRSSFERRRDLNPPDSCAAQRTLWRGQNFLYCTTFATAPPPSPPRPGPPPLGPARPKNSPVPREK